MHLCYEKNKRLLKRLPLYYILLTRTEKKTI